MINTSLSVFVYAMHSDPSNIMSNPSPWGLLFGISRSHRPSCIVTTNHSSSDRNPLNCMMTSSNGNIFRVTGHLCGESTRWILRTKASDAELWCFLWSVSEKKRLSKQSWGWWFETLSRPLWRHCNGIQQFDVDAISFLCLFSIHKVCIV